MITKCAHDKTEIGLSLEIEGYALVCQDCHAIMDLTETDREECHEVR